MTIDLDTTSLVQALDHMPLPNHPKHIAGILYGHLTQAETNLDLWEALREGRTSAETVKVMQPYGAFFISAENALFDSSVIILYRLLETRPDTVSFSSLLLAMKGALPEAELERFTTRVKELKPVWIKINVLRNRAVGHHTLDSTLDAVFEQAALTLSEIREFIAGAQRLLADLTLRAFDNAVVFNARSKPHVVRLLDHLLASGLPKLKPSLQST